MLQLWRKHTNSLQTDICNWTYIPLNTRKISLLAFIFMYLPLSLTHIRKNSQYTQHTALTFSRKNCSQLNDTWLNFQKYNKNNSTYGVSTPIWIDIRTIMLSNDKCIKTIIFISTKIIWNVDGVKIKWNFYVMD